MKTHPSPLPPPAFTRLELMVVLSILGLLAAVSAPALAVSANRSARVACLNNLRLIGRAFQMWAGDFDGENPWRVPQSAGGTRGHPLAPFVWWQFSFISNQLVTPRILVCASDDARVKAMAKNWSLGPGGLLNSANRNNSLSYPLGVHTSANVPQAILSGDRNLRYSPPSDCSLGMTNLCLLQGSSTEPSWTNNIHGLTGNVLFNDGRVLQASSAALQAALRILNIASESNVFHFLTP
jgi:hypothetical protein